MIRPSSPMHLASVSVRLAVTTAFALMAAFLLFALIAVPPRASAARAHKAACVAAATHHGEHRAPRACAAHRGTHNKGHKKSGGGGGSGKSKTGAHRAKHATRKHHAAATAPTIGAPGEHTEASCSDGTNATAGEETGFTCANGAEPGCPDGFVPAISPDGSTLLCEPEYGGEAPSGGGGGGGGEDEPESGS